VIPAASGRRAGPFAVLLLALAFCLSASCLSAPSAWARDPDYPALTGRVTDEAGILSDATKQTITGWLAGFERDTGRQVVVATVKSLQDQPIEDYAVGLFRHWGLGEKDKNTGALLLVAPNERKVRIEVGYGLEGELTDALSGMIIQQRIVPAFKRGDYDTGVSEGTAAILGVLGWKNGPQVQPLTPQADYGDGGGLGSLLFFGFIVIFVVFRILFGVGGRSRPGLWGASSSGWGGGGWGGGGWGSGGGFSGGGGSSGGGGASGGW
jgi:uncharacterized protein